ncbi:hypothetical protein F7D01_05335 [Erythrobacter sp. 3-20A1M]|uniref:right-handed parallel beta-helix repeat-containing protein n=1 Tax=Erythrobacter sp. 3-20A1M TaxID=2653850 RepID=UPI001BFC7F41|nr:right-handed parallel beta-helix repeat-containing protein [Erythrobacter sp. 3-20A1M]QWC56592.1 hypothetical protein F7D01_05335 [Erythrobacter sp. 3-20A1M]
MPTFAKSTTRRIAIAMGLLLASAACGQPAAQANDQASESVGETVVSSVAQLERAVASATPGSVIRISSGRYPAVSLKDIRKNGNVTIMSADPANPAIFSRLSLRDVSGLTLSHLSIIPDEGVSERYALLALNCQDVEFRNLTFRGAGDRINRSIGPAVMLRSSSNIRFLRSNFAFFRHGLAMLDLKNLIIAQNEFDNLQTDAIRGGGVSDAIIENNVMTGYHPAPKDHPDGIQLWSTHQDEPGRNIVIRDNLVVRGEGGPTQGVFIRDTKKKMPFENVEVSGNLVIGSLYNGIAMGGVRGGVMRDNEVIAYPDRKSWIRIGNSGDVRMTGNRASKYVIRDNVGRIEQSENRETEPTSSDLGARIQQWVATKPGFAEYRGPVLKKLLQSR